MFGISTLTPNITLKIIMKRKHVQNTHFFKGWEKTQQKYNLKKLFICIFPNIEMSICLPHKHNVLKKYSSQLKCTDFVP